MENFVNPHMEKWAEYTQEMLKAMKENDVAKLEELKTLADKEYSEYKEFADKMYSCNGFEACNQAIQESLTTLVKTNTKAVKEIMTLIKEDKNLSAQFSFYNSLNDCNTNDTLAYITEALHLVSSKIDYKTINESNNKLISLVRKYGIVPKEKFSDDKKQLFENCEYILTNKKKISNLNNYSNKLNNIAEYVKNNITPLNENKENIFNLIENFETKYSDLLNEEEKSFVKEIADFRANANVEKKQKFFESLKNQCIEEITKLIDESNDDEKNDLIAIREDIKSREFCEETLVKNIAKLLELRDVLLDK